jgi:glycyl-tRNA synthetase beta chain
MSLKPQLLSEVTKRLAAVRAFAALPEAAALAAANKRVNNILKKNSEELKSDTKPTRSLLQAPEEIAVYDVMKSIFPQAEALLAKGDYAGQLKLAASLRVPVDAFFEKVMVMAEEPVLRQQRLALLSGLQWHMNQVADISKLAT